MPAADVSVVIVSWNTRELLRRCLASLRASEGRTLETIVVDNGSTDGSVEMVRAEFSGVSLLESGANRGFAWGTNLGLARARGAFQVWLNSDCEVEPRTIDRLCAYLESHPEAGVAGPRLVWPDGRQQPSAQAFPTPARMFVRAFGVRVLMRSRAMRSLLRPLASALGPMPRGYFDSFDEAARARAVDWVSGACVATSRATSGRVGPLDEGYFMYCEDTDWCQRVRALGLEVHFVPGITVVHHAGGSGSSSPFVTYQHHRSLIRYMLRWEAAKFARWRSWLALQFALRALVADAGRVLGGGDHPWWRLRSLCLAAAVPEDPLA